MLIALVNRDTPDEVWILGDLFHLSVHQMGYPLAQLERLQSAIPAHIVIMTGNHDADILQKSVQRFSSDHLEVVVTPFVKLVHAAGSIPRGGFGGEALPPAEGDPLLTTSSTIWLTHDGGNPTWLSEAECIPYLENIRTCWGIPRADILLTGHTHRVIVSEQGKTRSLGVWNIPGHGDTLNYTYARIVAGMSEFQVKFCHVKP